ncbi:enoyl-CoA hydratase [Gammaproteobacteria bacterium LSUCC0057]|uniref:Enoyl-CoA hydratase n=1 Tax=Gammaproteobacteria bacterium LSUCC0057 TaxID=2559237 RepID=A0A4Y8UNR7_9GAMM|nr:enoyl-CoA hydratase [Gammaproteobacteria bacterium LSUCC0057]
MHNSFSDCPDSLLELANVRVEQKSHVIRITIDRSDRLNALDPATHAEMAMALDYYQANDELWVAIVTAQGDKAFCVGSDIGVISKAQKEEDYTLPETGYGGLTSRSCSKPVIVAVNGLALGGGFEIVLAADVVIAAEHAKFGLPEPKIGAAAVGGGVHRLARRLPRAQAMQLLLTGDSIDAATAMEWGLVNAVVAAEQLQSEALIWAERILQCAPLSLQATKELFDVGLQCSDEQRAIAQQQQGHYPLLYKMQRSADTQEGLQAFVEKRKPHWRGI